MEIKLFKALLNEVLVARRFSKKNSYYFLAGEDCICILGLQKSNFSTGYYVNVGIILKGLHHNYDNLKDTDGDIRTRLTYMNGGKEVDFFDLEKLSNSDDQLIKESISKNVSDIIEPALKIDGLRRLLADRPVLLYQTRLTAKEFLGISLS